MNELTKLIVTKINGLTEYFNKQDNLEGIDEFSLQFNLTNGDTVSGEFKNIYITPGDLVIVKEENECFSCREDRDLLVKEVNYFLLENVINFKVIRVNKKGE